MKDIRSTAGDALKRLRIKHWMRAVDRIGARPSLKGKPTIINNGKITIGEDFYFSSDPVQSHIAAINGGTVRVGDRVHISYGAAIAGLDKVEIGDDTRIGPFVQIMDSDFHRPGDRDAPGDTGPISIGRSVTIGARVAILRGTTIGDGATILSGSMVSGYIAAGETARGVPARAVRDAAAGGDVGLSQLVQSVLGLSALPAMTDGPEQIPEWDSLGALRLLLAVEETYGISVGEHEFQSAATIAALSELVEASRRYEDVTGIPA
ncbi:MAG: hypothetical protein JSS54_13560 [Proteobacteria bacterium]|nr:hypothetical protein [Pseudomonadota bacterium]